MRFLSAGHDALNAPDSLRLHWPEYLMEAGELGFIHGSNPACVSQSPSASLAAGEPIRGCEHHVDRAGGSNPRLLDDSDHPGEQLTISTERRLRLVPFDLGLLSRFPHRQNASIDLRWIERGPERLSLTSRITTEFDFDSNRMVALNAGSYLSPDSGGSSSVPTVPKLCQNQACSSSLG
jgi:hypothetical protein